MCLQMVCCATLLVSRTWACTEACLSLPPDRVDEACACEQLVFLPLQQELQWWEPPSMLLAMATQDKAQGWFLDSGSPPGLSTSHLQCHLRHPQHCSHCHPQELPSHGLCGIQEEGPGLAGCAPGCLRGVSAGPPGADLQPVCRYVQHYGLGSACDSIERVLKSVAVKLGKTQKVKVLTGTGE